MRGIRGNKYVLGLIVLLLIYGAYTVFIQLESLKVREELSTKVGEIASLEMLKADFIELLDSTNESEEIRAYKELNKLALKLPFESANKDVVGQINKDIHTSNEDHSVALATAVETISSEVLIRRKSLSVLSERLNALWFQVYIFIYVSLTLSIGFIVLMFGYKALFNRKQAIEEDKGVFERFFELSNNSLLMVNEQGNIIKANSTFLDQFGYLAEELENRPFEVFIHPSSRDSAEQVFGALVREKKSVQNFICECVSKSSESFWYSWNVEIDLDTQTLYCVGTDINQIIENDKAKHKFIASIHHNFKTPVHGVKGIASMLLQEELSKNGSQSVLGLQRIGNEMDWQLNKVLNVLLIEEGAFELDNDLVRFSDFVEMFEGDSRYYFERMGLSYSLTVETGIPESFYGDKDRLYHVIAQLLLNSIKYTKNGGVELKVSASSAKDKLVFQVIDSGIGIRSSDIHKVFEKYYQVDSSNKETSFVGTGVGLFIVQSIVEKMGGTVELSSTYGKGTSVTVAIPFKKGEQSYKIDLANKKVLLVEDNQVNQYYGTHLLKLLDIEPELASNGEECLMRLQSNDYDLILMDLRMPVMGGLEATAKIRKELKLSTPIIGCTANPKYQDNEACLEVKMNGFLPKPYDLAALKVAMITVLNGDGQSVARDHSEQTKRFDSIDKAIRAVKQNLDSDTFEQLKTLFLNSISSSLEKMDGHLESLNFQAMRNEAHHLSGSLATLQLNKLIEDMANFQKSCDQENSVKMKSEYDNLKKQLERVAELM